MGRLFFVPAMTGASPRPRLLLIDPHSLCSGLRDCLVVRGCEVSPAGPTEALGLIESEPPSLVIIAGKGELDASAVFEKLAGLRERDVFVPIVVLLEGGDVNNRVKALRDGADECLDLPVADEELFARVDSLLRIKSIQDRMHKSRRELQKLSTTDSLTGALNRRHFEERAREEFRRAKRYRDPLSLMVLDIDGFRQVNEEHGDEVGSEVLKAFSRLVKDAVRDVDLVGRLGGDTFCLLLPQTHMSGALTVAERVRRTLSTTPFHVCGVNVSISASTGVAFFPSREISSQEDLLRLAREALFRARQQGPGRIGLYQGAHYLYQSGEDRD